MRGKVSVHRGPVRAEGITPAHAGKSVAFFNGAVVVGDHPRACGEKPGKRLVLFRTVGSPPRMRGKAPRRTFPVTLPGITPAHAGKSDNAAPFKVFIWDHPRACGEKFMPLSA